MTLKPLLIAGAGGFGRETLEAVRSINGVVPTWDVLGFLDDDPLASGRRVDGEPIVGTVEKAGEMASAMIVITTGHPGDQGSRIRVVERLALPADRYATIVHPTASVGTSVVVGHGSVLLAQVVATTCVRIGAHVAVMPHVTFTHDDVIGEGCTFGAGARIAGRVTIESGVYVGSGAMIREDLRVERGALIGMGSVVTRDVPAGERWIGVPARRMDALESDTFGAKEERAAHG